MKKRMSFRSSRKRKVEGGDLEGLKSIHPSLEIPTTLSECLLIPSALPYPALSTFLPVFPPFLGSTSHAPPIRIACKKNDSRSKVLCFSLLLISFFFFYD